MDKYTELIEQFKLHFNVSKKQAERLLAIYLNNEDKSKSLIEFLENFHSKYKQCKTCFSLVLDQDCMFCENEERDQNIICVVANVSDVFSFEKSKFYNGLYHVLNGEINIRNGILPENLTLNQLNKRLDVNIVKEVIIALSSTFEGEVTSQFIRNNIVSKEIKVTRLAKGISTGSSIDYLDEETLKQALKGRTDI
ncbi:recombination mediator RecR [Spiroplasma endosymbiont of Anurida maritima]|uniref:recombination mediator RecR n=1 Tax=Spiroplasma endosymbiont of Anurida maritima TaxID=2967972 RepID=UPI0036D33EE7